MGTKALAYLRVSGRGQVDGDGFERQRQAIQNYAEQHGIEVMQEYRDEGVSGTLDAPDRPALTELLAAVNDGPVRLVLVERADRLARDLIVGELLLAEFRKLGVAIIGVDGGVDLTAADADPTKKLIRQLLGALAEWEKTALVMKLRAARQRIRRTGERCEGDKPFGFKPGEDIVLAKIKHLTRKPPGGERLSAGRIATVLNEGGYKSRSGKPWNRGSVWAILRRESGKKRSARAGVKQTSAPGERSQ